MFEIASIKKRFVERIEKDAYHQNPVPNTPHQADINNVIYNVCLICDLRIAQFAVIHGNILGRIIVMHIFQRKVYCTQPQKSLKRLEPCPVCAGVLIKREMQHKLAWTGFTCCGLVVALLVPFIINIVGNLFPFLIVFVVFLLVMFVCA